MIRLGVCGWPVAHSRSPRMHNAALAHLGLEDWRYQRLPIPPHLFSETVKALPAAGFRGVNVTIPHKEQALALADTATETAQRIGAANTLTFDRTARSTPTTPTPPGFLTALQTSAYDKTALVLGAGGSARAVAVRAQCGGRERGPPVEPHAGARARRWPASSAPTTSAEPAEIVVNCTSVGLQNPADTFKALPIGADDLGAGRTVVDLVYRHGGTLLLNAAQATARRWSTGWRSSSPRAQRRLSAGPAGRLPIRRCGRPSQTSPHELDLRHPAPKPKPWQRHHHALAARRLGPRAHGRDRRPRVRRAAARWTARSSAATESGTPPSACSSTTARSARTSSRAPSPSASGSTTSTSALPRRPRRRQARRPGRRAPLPGRARLLRRRPHAARRHGRPRQRARHRRHRGHDRLRGPARGRLAGATSSGCSSASRTPTSATARSPPTRRTSPTSRRRRRAPARAARRAALRPARERADQLRRRRRGRDGHPARAPGDQGGRRARRLRHPLRARGRGDADPLPHRRRAPGGRDRAVERRPRRRLPHQDPLRPRHRRAPDPAGRPHLARRRRQADRPARRHAAGRLRREGRHAHPGPVRRS